MNLVLDTTLEFYQKTVDHTNDRFLSFDHCYKHFQNLKQPPKNEQLEISMLHLGFYLASWGMYRGSSFLLQKDYTIFKPIVNKILDSKYQCLRTLDTTMNSGNSKELAALSFSLHEELQNEFEKARKDYYHSVNKYVPSEQISSVLTTKVMLGTLACVPAYDRYFKKGINTYIKENPRIDLNQTFSRNSITQLYQFVLDNKKELIELQKKVETITNITYPLLKLVDSYFWTIGYKVMKVKEEKTD
jgi:hypothetical protein